MRPKRLFIFDMDGTLLPSTTALIEIAKRTGHYQELHQLEEDLSENRIENAAFATAVSNLWFDIITQKTVKDAFMDSPKMHHIKEVLEDISRNGDYSCLITLSLKFYARHFLDFGFNYIFASEYMDIENKTLQIHKILDAKHKPHFAKEICKKHQLDFASSAAFGDSSSDLLLFQELHHTVAVNAKQNLRSYAKHHYDGLDLMHAYSLVK